MFLDKIQTFEIIIADLKMATLRSGRKIDANANVSEKTAEKVVDDDNSN